VHVSVTSRGLRVELETRPAKIRGCRHHEKAALYFLYTDQ